ncbi:MAG TPA: branched-chain amino acid ABC transporter permease [Streptosporangiaceae bacterium]|nr:branched-chain amino acid ABC transporter permease [Streptosporangiaceae bacterium]
MLETTLAGLVQGGAYALSAVGLVLVFGVAGVPNLAHGESVMLGGIVAAVLAGHGVPFAVAIAGGAAAACLLGIVMGATVFDRLRNFPLEGMLIASLALIFIIEAVTTELAGDNPRAVSNAPAGTFRVFGAPLPASWLIVFVAGIGLVGVLQLLIRYTRWGRGMRAMALNPAAAVVVGIPTRRYAILAFAVGSLMAGISGGLLAGAFPMDPTYGESVAFVAFTIIIFAGMGSIGGALLGGLLLGLVESFATAYLSSAYADTFQFLVLLGILLIRPEGLFGVRVERA